MAIPPQRATRAATGSARRAAGPLLRRPDPLLAGRTLRLLLGRRRGPRFSPDGKEAVLGSSPREGLNTCKAGILLSGFEDRAPLSQGGGRCWITRRRFTLSRLNKWVEDPISTYSPDRRILGIASGDAYRWSAIRSQSA